MTLAALPLLLGLWSAHATEGGATRAPDAPRDSGAAENDAAEDDDLSENTLSGKKAATPAAGADAADSEILAWLARPHHADSYRAAEALGSKVEMLDECREAIELIYKRRYKDARKVLDGVRTKYPTTGLGPLGLVLIYQALMFENFDWRYEKQYELAFKDVRAQVDVGLATPGDEAFEHFVLAGALGIDAIHKMRKTEFLPALNRAYEALKALEKTKKLAPTFADASLGDGLYLYWRTVASQSSKLLPAFEDKRVEGLALMEKAEKESLLLGPGATLALAYSYIEERKLKSALERCLYARLEYPDNVVNNMTLGRIYTSMRRYPDALRVYDDILDDAPDNQRAHYFRGVVLARSQRYDEAQKAYETYLGFKDVPKDARGQTLYRLGALHMRQKRYDKAEGYFKQAIAETGNEAAKRALERLRKLK